MTPTLQVSCEILVKYQCFKVSFSLSNTRNRKAVNWHYITMSYVGNTIRYVIMKKKKKKKERKKRKEKKTFRKVNKMSQELRKQLRGKCHSCCSEWIRMVYLATEYNLRKSHIRLSKLYFCLVSHPLPGLLGGRSRIFESWQCSGSKI